MLLMDLERTFQTDGKYPGTVKDVKELVVTCKPLGMIR